MTSLKTFFNSFHYLNLAAFAKATTHNSVRDAQFMHMTKNILFQVATRNLKEIKLIMCLQITAGMYMTKAYLFSL